MANAVKIIGVCLSEIHQEDRLHFIEALNRHACKDGYRLIVFNSCSDLFVPADAENIGEISVFKLIPYQKLSAMIMFPYFLSDNPVVYQVIDQCRRHKIPVITIDKVVAGCTSFAFAYADVFERLCRHVIEHHHAKDLLMMAGSQDNLFSDDRMMGFRRALEINHIPFREDMIGFGGFWEEPTHDTMVRWFEKEQRPIPDAIICANDTMAITVSIYLQKRGIRVPEECIVTGFDGIAQSNYHIPHLTTCRPDYDKMGAQLVDAVNKLVRGKVYPASNIVDFEVFKSQSCGCQPVTAENINDAVQDIYAHLLHSKERQELMCRLQSYVANISGVDELSGVMTDKFVFHTAAFALNNDFYDPERARERAKNGVPFTEELDVLFHRYFWWQGDRQTLPLGELVPKWDMLLEREDPVLVCAMHFLDFPMGYCVFQPKITIDDYEKVHTFMNAIDAALGTLHSRTQIRAINSKLQAVNAELDRLYAHDHMTGLFNRHGFYREFHTQQMENTGLKVSVVFISADLDGLKTINDTYGHLEGDNAIIAVAHALQKSAVQNEICARFGGDEFAVAALIRQGDEDAYFKAYNKRFQDYLASYNKVSENPYSVEASIGYYAEPLREDFDLDVLIKNADDMMYSDKHKRKAERK